MRALGCTAALAAAIGLERGLGRAEAGCRKSARTGGGDEVTAVSNMASLCVSAKYSHFPRVFRGI